MNSGKCSKAMKIACYIYIQKSGTKVFVVGNVKILASILVVRNGTGNALNVDSMNPLLPTHFSTG
jgi:hypothetical protein